jgi:hypothetical protein
MTAIGLGMVSLWRGSRRPWPPQKSTTFIQHPLLLDSDNATSVYVSKLLVRDEGRSPCTR